MRKNSGRRAFIRNVGISGLSATILPVTGFANSIHQKPGEENKKLSSLEKGRPYNTAYKNEHLNRIAFPIGGMGAGMFCMEGTGSISHISVRNKPEIFNTPAMFAAISVKGLKNGAKLLEGPVPDWKKFGQLDAGNGATGATTGLPRFRNASFKAKFPFAYLDISDPDLPFKIEVTGWSPFHSN